MTQPAQAISLFDIWRPGYAGATVEVVEPNTVTPKNLWYDQAQTSPAGNPQTLETYEDADGRRYGKFDRPIYVLGSYEILINGIDKTGIIRQALTSLQDEDASYAVSSTQRSNRQRRLIDRFNDRVLALDFGELGGTPATNTKTLTAAIGAAAGQGGGEVIIPPGTYRFEKLTLPVDVVLGGADRSGTVLQSQEDEAVITYSGDRAGLRNLTLDGINLVANSIGVDSLANSEIVHDNVLIKRFNTGLRCKGGDRADWRQFSIDNCNVGALLTGDSNAGGGGGGGAFEFNRWRGGRVTACVSAGIRLAFVDQIVRNNLFTIGFENNVAATAFDIEGARKTQVRDSWWSGNNRNINVADDTDTSLSALNTTIGLFVEGGYMNGGTNAFDDTCQDIVFKAVDFAGVAWGLSLPLNPILLQDCTEDLNVTLSGDTTKLIRKRVTQAGEVSGVTTDATATVAWAQTLQPGQIALIEAKAIGNQRDGTGYGIYHVEAGARRPGATLDYDNQTANFTVGKILTGQSSGATARIIGDSDSGASGTLTVRDISGAFQDNEQITDESGGSALVNGTLATSDTALDSGGVTALRPAVESNAGLNCTLAANGADVQAQVTGLASTVYEWTLKLNVFLP